MDFIYETQMIEGQECKVRKLYEEKELITEEEVVNDIVNGFFYKYDDDIFYKTYKYKNKYYGFALTYKEDELVSVMLRFPSKTFYDIEIGDNYFRYANGDWTDSNVNVYKIYADKATQRVLSKQGELIEEDRDKVSVLKTISNQINAFHDEAKQYAFDTLPNDVAKNVLKQMDEIMPIVDKLLNS